MNYFLSNIPNRLSILSADMVRFGIINSDISEIFSACSSLGQVTQQLEAHISCIGRYNRQSIQDIKRVHRTLDFLTYLARRIAHEVIYTDSLDRYGCLRAWMAFNKAMETNFDRRGWMDDYSCQRRLVECKEMLLRCCDDEYVKTFPIKSTSYAHLLLSSNFTEVTPGMRSCLRDAHRSLDNDRGIGFEEGNLLNQPMGF